MHYPGILVRDGRTCGEDELPPVRPRQMPIPPKKPKAPEPEDDSKD